MKNSRTLKKYGKENEQIIMELKIMEWKLSFDDNIKILAGDYSLERSQNIDDCRKSELLPVIYPMKY